MTYLLSVLQAQKLVHILSKGGYSQPTREDNGTSNQWAPLMCAVLFCQSQQVANREVAKTCNLKGNRVKKKLSSIASWRVSKVSYC